MILRVGGQSKAGTDQSNDAWSIIIKFCEYPKNVTLPIGSETNSCQHVSLEATIGYGSSTGLFPDITYTAGSIHDNGTLVNTLTILVKSEYNETLVECVAFFPERSPIETHPVTLTITACRFIIATHPMYPT